MECRTVSDDHAVCELVANEDGELVVRCGSADDDEDEDRAAKAKEDDKAARAAALRHL
jgi:hypothetical protein